MATTFQHRGTEIALTESGSFVATVGGKRLTFPSLASARKKIDDAAKSEFVAFDALRDREYGDSTGTPSYVAVRIVGVTKRRGRREELVWVDEKGREREEVYADTPENRQALDEADAMGRRHSEEYERQRQETNAAHRKIIKRTPAA